MVPIAEALQRAHQTQVILCRMAVMDTSALRTMWRGAAHDPANQDGSRGLCAEMLPPAQRSRASAPLLPSGNATHSLPLLFLLFSCQTMSDSLRPHGLPHARLPHPSLSPGVAQTHVHGVGDAFQPSHPLLLPSPALNLSQHQGLFQ